MEFTQMVAGGMFILMIVVLLYLALIALLIISSWKINTKAGQEGWACLIPIYSTLIQLESTCIQLLFNSCRLVSFCIFEITFIQLSFNFRVPGANFIQLLGARSYFYSTFVCSDRLLFNFYSTSGRWWQLCTVVRPFILLTVLIRLL